MKKNNVIIMIVLTLFLFNTSCDLHNTSNPFDNAHTQRGPNELIAHENNPNSVLYQLSYDQTTVSYDANVTSDSEKYKSDKFKLESYERVKKTITIDKDGFLHTTTVWLDGNADITMPVELYRSTIHIRPAQDNSYKPVVRSEMGNGYIRYFAKDGTILHEYKIDNSDFRVDPKQFRDMIKTTRQEKNNSQRISANLQALQQQGAKFTRKGENIAELARSINGDPKIASQVQHLDLRIGQVIRSQELRHDDKVQNREFMNYKKVNGLPVLKNSVSEHFGEKNGKWEVTNRTIVNRDNLKLITN